MFGYVTVNEKELKVREYEEYQSWYCGLCNTLHKNYGRSGQMTLNYDMTFLIYLLNGLYEPEVREFTGKCIPHPIKKRVFRQTEISSYAADMNILLAWYKLLDDWDDEKKITARLMMSALKKGAGKVIKKYPEKAAEIGREFKKLRKLEEKNSRDIDRTSSCFGRVMACICRYRSDEWSEELGQLGSDLGRYIYIMDAYEDLEEDIKKKRYNCLVSHSDGFGDSEKFDAFIFDLLNAIMANVAKAFEKLPVIRDAEVIRNIIYAGIWSRWDQIQNKRYENRKNKDYKDK